ncbi:DUF1330 domain-containing protein [Streptomyces huiliensis]|uniref:DUF1330 domain-containing protein n=1 Tax=Streptomyces huiliensis TaxID=2876027 RepID=UPI001CC0CEF7|nr:DUF1330 domain-containing protein [Streptomyces huiliensis]MBZ4319605.1 DUF1330 domain-containing protein [Streptomyces huiliensis]
MPAYALGHFRSSVPHADVVAYVERIQDTLDPFGGRFVVHGGEPDVREGAWEGDLVLIEFPDLERAREWYDSPAYQELIPLRTPHVVGDVLLAAGVGPGYHPSAKAEAIRAAMDG